MTFRLWPPARLVFSTWPTVMLPVVSGCGSMWYRTICASSCLQGRRHLVKRDMPQSQQGTWPEACTVSCNFV